MRSTLIPKKMLAATIEEFGGADEIKIQMVPVPKLSSQSVLVKLDTAGVGIWDTKTREGAWAEDESFPMILGVDGSGVVAAVGSRVRRFSVGDRVYSYSYANSKGGFHAQYVAVPASKVARVPSGVDLFHAGAVPVTGLTALQGVDDALKIRKGETLLVHGASGSVGCLAVQFAKLRGARVLATASGARGVEFVRGLGVDNVIDGRRANIIKAAHDFAPDGVDAVLAFAGGKEFEQCLKALRKGGRAAFPNGVEPAPRGRKDVRTRSYDAKTGLKEFQRLGRAIANPRVQVPTAEVYSLEDAAKAHRRLERGHVRGKVLLRMPQ